MANAARERFQPADRQIEPLTGPHSPGTAPSQTPPRRVVAILAAHNRREMTLSLLAQLLRPGSPLASSYEQWWWTTEAPMEPATR